jgi:hypothetical protein
MNLSFLHRIQGVREHSSARQYTQFSLHCSFSTVFFLIARLKICDLSPFNFFVKLVGWEPALGSFRTMGVTASHSG